MPDHLVEQPYDFQLIPVKRFVVPELAADPGAPVNGQLWRNTTSGITKLHSGGATIELGGGLTTEQVQDIVGAFFGDTADLDVTYDDAGNAIGAVIKAGVITDAHVAGAAAIAYAKLALTGSITNADIAAAAAIARSKLNFGAGLVNADIAAGAAIDLAKLATNPLARANHTGTQLANTISDFAAAVAALSIDADTLEGSSKAQLTTDITAAIIDAAPGTLNTLNELAAALGDDPNFAATINAALALRPRQVSASVGNGALTVIDVPHALNTFDITYRVWDAAGARAERFPGAEKPDVNTLRLTFAAAPAAASIRVVVAGL